MNASTVAGIGDPGGPRPDAGLDRPGSPIPATVRAAWRACVVTFFSICALLEIGFTLPCVRRDQRVRARAEWLHRWCSIACRILGLRLTIRGSVPHSGLLVCNHLSYVDIIVLSSIQPCVFVAKRDVAAWPLFGWLARAAGTIFVERHRRIAARVGVDRVREAIAGGSLVVLFPEGTSSDGATVLPFKPALLEPALQLGCAFTSGAIDYSLAQGSVADEVCYWRDMTLVPHLLNLFTKRSIGSTVSFERFEPRHGSDRKEVAHELRRLVVAMR